MNPIYHAPLQALGLDPHSPTLEHDLSTTDSGNQRNILGTSVKVEKGEKAGVLTAVVYLSPATEAGLNMCPMATPGCSTACLGHSSGRLALDSAKRARMAKTLWFRLYPASFLARLDVEIVKHARRAERMGKVAAIRMNGSSDIRWEKHGVPQRHPNVRFYDYTKLPARTRRTRPDNYHLTYSLSEDARSMGLATEWLDAGGNVAIVVAGPLGTRGGAAKRAAQAILDGGTLHGYPVIDGDADDVRFYDEPGSWVVLYAKGSGIHDETGFVQRFAMAS